jgi:putative DNA primase/helicase
MMLEDDPPPSDDDAPDAPPKPNGRPPLRIASAHEEPEWMRGLLRANKGALRKVASNACMILAHEPAWQCVRWDAFRDRFCIDPAALPNMPHLPPIAQLPRPPSGDLTDDLVHYAQHWIGRAHGLDLGSDALRAALVFAAHQRPFHPLRDYLDRCAAQWDQQPRICAWLADYLGAERDAYHLRIGAMWLVSAVARAYQPGTKVDYVLALEGPQGAAKNRALETLFGDAWYLPELPDLRDKDSQHALAGIWCACIDELRAIRAADVERVKSYLTRRIDRYRPPYGRDMVERPRSNVFAATTNADAYLTDETGNRRWWGCAVGTIDVDAIARDRDLLWGEAVVRYRAGEQWWPDASDMIALTGAQQQREVQDVWAEDIARATYGIAEVSIADAMGSLGIETARRTPADAHRVARVLTAQGWVRARVDGARGSRVWRRVAAG